MPLPSPNGHAASFDAAEVPRIPDLSSGQATHLKEQPSPRVSTTEEQIIEDPKPNKADELKKEIEELAGVLTAEAEAPKAPDAIGGLSSAGNVSPKEATGAKVVDESGAWPFAGAAADSVDPAAKNVRYYT